MAKKKIKINYFSIILILLFLFGLGIILYGGHEGWFKFTINVPAQNQTPPPLSVAPAPQQPVFSSCSQVCSQNGFSNSYSSNTCKAGETKITYGYPNQPSILVCCCWNEAPPTDTDEEPKICYDSDISLSPFEEQLKFAGFCTDSSGTNSDYCYEGTDHLIEYYCEPLYSPPAERHCGYTSYNCPGMIPGSHCSNGKCVIDGGGSGDSDGSPFGGYASCDAYKIAKGKEFYVTGANLNNIDECEAYAQGYCSQFGSVEPHVVGGTPPGYVTMLDFVTINCCIWNCNWSWE